MNDGQQIVATAETPQAETSPANAPQDRAMASKLARVSAAALAVFDRDNPISIKFLRSVVADDVKALTADDRKFLKTVWEEVQAKLADESFAVGIEASRIEAVEKLRELIEAKDIATLAVLLRLLKPASEKAQRENSIEFDENEAFKLRNKPIYRLADNQKADTLRLEGFSERLILAHAEDVAEMLEDPETVAEVIEEARVIAGHVETVANCGDQLPGGVYVQELGMAAVGLAETKSQFKNRVRAAWSDLGVEKKKPKK